MKAVKLFFLLLGIFTLWLTVRAVGLELILARIAEMKGQLIPILGVYALANFLFAVGWYFSFPKNQPHPIPCWDLYHIRLVGETFNSVIPWAASLGGEPFKAHLLRTRHGISLSEGYASLLIVHAAFYLSLALLVTGAIGLTFHTLPLTPVLKKTVLVALVFLSALIILLALGLRHGLFSRIHRLGERFHWWGNHSEEKKQRFLELDAEIRLLFGKNRQRFLYSTLFNFLAWFAGSLEIYLISQVIQIPIGLAEATLLEALIQVLRIITFFIPASIGAQEGGIVLMFLQFGFEKPVGVTVALIRRIREIIWIGIGLATWLILDRKRIEEAANPS